MKQIITFGTCALTILCFALPAYAVRVDTDLRARASVGSTTVDAALDAKIATRIEIAKQHADQEIDRRMKALSDLNARIEGMVRLTASAKTTLQDSLLQEIAKLGALKVKIHADTDMPVLKADILSVTQLYRVYMLVVPQTHITIAADKIHFVVNSMTALANKLSVRIEAATAAGKDTKVVAQLLLDLNAKLTDANVQADSAVSMSAGLTPDNGDKAKATANEAALKSARAKIKASTESVHQARKSAGTIVKALIDLQLDSNVSSTVVTP